MELFLDAFQRVTRGFITAAVDVDRVNSGEPADRSRYIGVSKFFFASVERCCLDDDIDRASGRVNFQGPILGESSSIDPVPFMPGC